MYHRAQNWTHFSLCLALLSLPFTVQGKTTSVVTNASDLCIPECMCLSKTQISCKAGGLKEIPENLSANLEELSLSNNYFPEIKSEAFKRLRSLRKLYLDHNNISSINKFAFRGLSKLRYLSIQYTPLSYIGQYSFAALQNVSTIILAYNKIGYIMGQAFAGSSQIIHLMLNDNPLKTIHSNAFSGLTYVNHLVLAAGIKNIEPDAFNGLEYVGLLKLTFMDLEGLKPYTFRGLKNVHNLVIQTSDLGIIYKDAFFGLEHVHALDIVSNKIDAFEEFHLNSNYSINVLRFHQNHVLRAPKYGDASFHVNSISAEGNHFPCDCQIYLVLESDFVNGSADEFRRRNYCISAAEYNGKAMSLVDLDSIASCHDRLTKDNYARGSSVRSRAIVLLVLLAIAA